MPIDPRIALGVQQSTFDPAAVMQNALALRNSQQAGQLNQLKLQQEQQSMQEAAGLQNYLAQNPDLSSEEAQNRLVSQYGQKGLDILNTRQELANRRLQGKTQELEYNKANHERIDQLIGDVTRYTTADQANSALDSMLEKGEIDSQTHSMYRNIVVSTPWPQAKTQILGGLRTIQKQFEASAPAPEKVDVGGSIKIIDMNPNSPTYMKEIKSLPKTQTPAQASTGTTQIPKLKPGERWNPDLERVEQVPGSVEYNKQSKLHATDYSSLDTVKSTTKANVENVDELLKAANAWAAETNNGAKPLGSNASEDAKAFANLFPGSYTGYVTQYKSGATSTLKAKYQKLQSNAKNLGLQQTRVGGSIGTITEREWPMLQQQVLSLSPTMETAAAAAEIANIKNRFIDTQNLAADKYDTQWGETQYYKGAPATSAENSQIKNEAIKAFKSYEPDKYEYRINPSTGKVQRKAK